MGCPPPRQDTITQYGAVEEGPEPRLGPAGDPDADGGTEVAPSPAVARSYADPQLVYRHDHAHWLSRVSYTYVSELLSEAYRKPIVMPRPSPPSFHVAP